jgi:hypothetical protein
MLYSCRRLSHERHTVTQADLNEADFGDLPCALRSCPFQFFMRIGAGKEGSLSGMFIFCVTRPHGLVHRVSGGSEGPCSPKF